MSYKKVAARKIQGALCWDNKRNKAKLHMIHQPLRSRLAPTFDKMVWLLQQVSRTDLLLSWISSKWSQAHGQRYRYSGLDVASCSAQSCAGPSSSNQASLRQCEPICTRCCHACWRLFAPFLDLHRRLLYSTQKSWGCVLHPVLPAPADQNIAVQSSQHCFQLGPGSPKTTTRAAENCADL